MGRIRTIDGLRGVAILLVVSFHYLNNQLTDAANRIGKLLALATGFGWVGVDLFFVLSGFLIGRIILRNLGSPNLMRTFYLRRVLRIIPNYYLLLVVFLVINMIPWFDSSHFLHGYYKVPAWSYFPMLHNLYMAASNSLGNDALSITWSIGIEEQFYLIAPALIILFRKRVDWLLLAFVVLGPVSRLMYQDWVPRYVLLHCRFDSLAFGMILARIENHEPYRQALVRSGKWVLAAMGVIVLAVAFFYMKYSDLGVWKHSLFAAFFALLIVRVLFQEDRLLTPVLSNGALIWIGEISYSLYLFHYLVLGLFHHIHGRGGIGIHAVSDVWVSLAAFGFSLFLAWFIYRFLETRFTAIGKRYSY